MKSGKKPRNRGLAVKKTRPREPCPEICGLCVVFLPACKEGTVLGQKCVGNADGISGIYPLLGENRRRIASAGENTNIRAAKVVIAVLAYNNLPLRHKIGLSGAVADLAGVKCGAYRTSSSLDARISMVRPSTRTEKN